MFFLNCDYYNLLYNTAALQSGMKMGPLTGFTRGGVALYCPLLQFKRNTDSLLPTTTTTTITHTLPCGKQCRGQWVPIASFAEVRMCWRNGPPRADCQQFTKASGGKKGQLPRGGAVREVGKLVVPTVLENRPPIHPQPTPQIGGGKGNVQCLIRW